MKLSELLAHTGDCKIHITIRDDRERPKFHGMIHHIFDCGSDADRSMKNCRAFVNEVKVNLDINGDPTLLINAELVDSENDSKGGAE